MSPKFSSFLLYKVLGWHITPLEDTPVPEDKAIILAAPHTSIWDFVIGHLYYRSMGGKLKVMIKKEAFFWPFGPLLKAMGGIPIDRSNPSGLLVSLIHEMERPGTCHLVICPEGTRKPVRRWKTGYHNIASHTGVPVYLSHYDFAKKEVGRGQKIALTDDSRADTDRIQKAYAAMRLTALYPEDYLTE